MTLILLRAGLRPCYRESCEPDPAAPRPMVASSSSTSFARYWRRQRVKRATSRGRLERLLRLPWTVELRRNPSGRFFARIVELPGCMTEGKDEVETLEHLREALELWLETELERGRPIPKPGEYPAGRAWDFKVKKRPKSAAKSTRPGSRRAVAAR